MRVPRRPRSVLLTALLVATALTGCSSPAEEKPVDAQAVNPFSEEAGYAEPDSRAAQAASQAEADGESEKQRVFSRLAAVPQGIWLTPEEYPPGQVGPYVTSLVTAADKAGKLPLLVVYGIPDRDCSGGFSEGGLTAARYPAWVQEIATAAGAADRVAVVLEPDALAAALQCAELDQRIRLMKAAVDALAKAGVTTYVDGGHSDWISPTALAKLMRDVGVAKVRGFATNVANYQTDDDERDYAGKLSKLLGGAHFVIDTGRNGNGSTSDWCNPPGRAFGTAPGFVDDGTGLDAFVWIKPPGESDGECGGGPPAGEFWPERTMEIAAASGW
nr:glycoside hydrolase family 6 protein [Nocardioides luti]